MELQPGQNFTIVRQLGMPGDVETYYVQAVVKNSRTGAVLDTVNLTDQTNQRFTGVFQVPQDTSGQGLNIDITTTVYTDPGYTTQSNIYTIDNETYLVFDRLLPRSVAVGGYGGDSTDYKRIKKMLDDAIASIKIPEVKEPKEPKEIDLSGVLSRIDALKEEIVGVIESNIKPLDEKFKGIKASITSGTNSVSSLINTRAEFKETDLSPIIEKIDEIRFDITNQFVNDKTEDNLTKLVESSKEEIITKIDEKMDDAGSVLDLFTSGMEKAMERKSKSTIKNEVKEPTPTPPDYLEHANKLIQS